MGLVQQLAQRLQEPPAVTHSNWTKINVSCFLQKMTSDDYQEAYLTTFERKAEREGWPKEQWAGLVAPLLIGEVQKAYFNLDPVAGKHYENLKKEILARLGGTMALCALRVYNCAYYLDKPPCSQIFDLIHLVRKWT
ncbi:hypothetical protein XENTR_v10003940 [Xenopus tropicalis]|nr:hypothetical protein XENTR_v10003940 [Xenopus tropicalis]